MIRKCFKLFCPATATGYLLNKTAKSDQFDFNSCIGLHLKVFAREWMSTWDLEEGHASNGDEVRKLIFIRHGTYNDDGTGMGNLNVFGVVESNAAGSRLLQMVQSGKYRITRLHSSAMERALQTAEYIERAFKKANEYLPELEVTPTNMEGYPNKKTPATTSGRTDRQYWVDGARIDAVFRDQFRRPDPPRESQRAGSSSTADHVQGVEVYIGHSNLHRYYVCRALQLPLEALFRFGTIPGSFTEFSIHADGTITCDAVGEGSNALINLDAANLIKINHQQR